MVCGMMMSGVVVCSEGVVLRCSEGVVWWCDEEW